MLKTDQTPFSIYDFLGYLIPGTLFVYLIVGAAYIMGHDSLDEMLKIKNADENTINRVNAIAIVIVTMFSYVMGHFLSYVSTLIVETTAIRLYGYPMQSLLMGHKNRLFFNLDESETFGKKLTSILKGLLLLCVMAPVLLYEGFLKHLIFHGNAFWAKELDPLNKKIFLHKAPLVFAKCGVDLSTEMDELKSDMKSKYNYCQYLYHYAFKHSEPHRGKIQNYVALYGFTRVITMLFVMLFWATLFVYYYNYEGVVKKLGVYCDAQVMMFVILALEAFVAFIFFCDYYKFYRRYTEEIIQAICVLEIHEEPKQEMPEPTPPPTFMARLTYLFKPRRT